MSGDLENLATVLKEIEADKDNLPQLLRNAEERADRMSNQAAFSRSKSLTLSRLVQSRLDSTKYDVFDSLADRLFTLIKDSVEALRALQDDQSAPEIEDIIIRALTQFSNLRQKLVEQGLYIFIRKILYGAEFKAEVFDSTAEVVAMLSQHPTFAESEGFAHFLVHFCDFPRWDRVYGDEAYYFHFYAQEMDPNSWTSTIILPLHKRIQTIEDQLDSIYAEIRLENEQGKEHENLSQFEKSRQEAAEAIDSLYVQLEPLKDGIAEDDALRFYKLWLVNETHFQVTRLQYQIEHPPTP